MKQIFIAMVAMVLLLSSCFKEDERILPAPRGGKVTQTIELTQSYKYQVYYSLEDSAVVGTVEKKSFDLMFQADEYGSLILLNTANFMMAALTGTDSFDEVSSPAGLEMQFDPSDGNLNETALRNWITVNQSDTIYSSEVYVIHRGYDELGNNLGYRKIIFDSLKADRYYFRYAMLNSTEYTSAMVLKQPEKNFSYYSFDSQEQVFPEPDKSSYDLLFTQYTTLLFTNIGEPYPYLVTGALLNRIDTECVRDTSLVFDEVTLEDVINRSYSTNLDEIGYDWKEVEGDVNSGAVVYEVKPEYTYLVRNQHGFYFKLRFISYYNKVGEKGYPTFEFQRL
ncbi:MAG: HmuY family protein [Bacteroidales bacterium]|nr:HmuY family protein [Bacteroidales bacterium]